MISAKVFGGKMARGCSVHPKVHKKRFGEGNLRANLKYQCQKLSGNKPTNPRRRELWVSSSLTPAGSRRSAAWVALAAEKLLLQFSLH